MTDNNYVVEAVSPKNLGIKFVDAEKWINYKGVDVEKAREVLSGLRKGDVVMAFMNESGFTDLIPQNKTVADVKKSGGFLDDYITFEELLDDFIKSSNENTITVDSDLIHYNEATKSAVVKVTLYAFIKVGEKLVQRKVSAHGDCDNDNGGMVKMHYIRMAETRALCRAMRVILGVGKTSHEEMQ